MTGISKSTDHPSLTNRATTSRHLAAPIVAALAVVTLTAVGAVTSHSIAAGAATSGQPSPEAAPPTISASPTEGAPTTPATPGLTALDPTAPSALAAVRRWDWPADSGYAFPGEPTPFAAASGTAPANDGGLGDIVFAIAYDPSSERFLEYVTSPDGRLGGGGSFSRLDLTDSAIPGYLQPAHLGPLNHDYTAIDGLASADVAKVIVTIGQDTTDAVVTHGAFFAIAKGNTDTYDGVKSVTLTALDKDGNTLQSQPLIQGAVSRACWHLPDGTPVHATNTELVARTKPTIDGCGTAQPWKPLAN